ncbi:unnamed protein product [Pseudo-nitzschia multistriata]|uniref:Uncharacterized protein n=1 Tax=Pseudo-nitzschia multistriata TaxID=183589 RepID=A0A448ZIA6_9STRA|nr:unnamed protein product [Pseudo-nitzschia multistriata]
METKKYEKASTETRDRRRLIVLTLRKHQDGIWITKLVEGLKESAPPPSSSQHRFEIDVIALEDWLGKGWLISDKVETNDDDKSSIIGLVNRVSDAASPALFKACCGLLAVVENVLHIPVWNGSTAYSLAGNKWRHHILFRQANLSAPITMVYYTGYGKDSERTTERTVEIDTGIFRQNEAGRFELLIKPNAGGFGVGIEKQSILPLIASSSSDQTHSFGRKKTTRSIRIPESFEDEMALIQQYEQPIDGKLYRVWFLNGKVQCAVERTIHVAKKEEEQGLLDAVATSTAEFTSGCAGGSFCTLPGSTRNHSGNISYDAKQTQSNKDSTNGSSVLEAPKSLASTVAPSNMLPWRVPREVRREIEDQLLPLVADAHCGSIEFLHSSPCRSSATAMIRNGDTSEIHENDNDEVEMQTTRGHCPRRLYFDFNLLSTLPIIEGPKDVDSSAIEQAKRAAEMVWPKDYDPWLELARAIWEFFVTADA